MNNTLLRLTVALFIALGLVTAFRAEAKAPALQTTQGIFLGIEQGDYAHWNMRQKDGQKVSYFILNPDASLKKVLARPKSRVGQNCRVQWKTTTEDIPEAGGKTVVEQIVSVEWLGEDK